jgi:hypothetical protein
MKYSIFRDDNNVLIVKEKNALATASSKACIKHVPRPAEHHQRSSFSWCMGWAVENLILKKLL